MEVTALCFRLMLELLVLLLVPVHHSYFAQTDGAAFPRVRPDRLQFFEYEAVTVNCDEFRGLTEWRVMTKLNKIDPTNSYDSSGPSLKIHPALKRHSGEFWCEDGEGNRSRAVNISVTDGSVILEVPARPVVEGTKLILHCKMKDTKSKPVAEFYKNGLHLGTLIYEDLIIQNVSKSDEGLYRCSISGPGASPESWLAVSPQTEVVVNETLQEPPYADPPDWASLLWIGASVALLLLLLLSVLLLWWKHRAGTCLSGKPTPGSAGGQTGEDGNVGPHHETYAVVRKPKKQKASDGRRACDPDLVTYAVVNTQKKKREPRLSGSGTKRHPGDEAVVYSSVRKGAETAAFYF